MKRRTRWLFAFLVTQPLGCAARHPEGLRYAQVLQGPEEPSDVTRMIREPSLDCLRQAEQHVEKPSDIYSAPLPPALRHGYADVVRNLHPSAKQVLRRTDGVWFARDIPGAAARFVPCRGRGKAVGIILVDTSQQPLADTSPDADMPMRFWQLLGGDVTVERSAASTEAIEPNHNAARYVLLHELGHALSLLAGEFTLGPEAQFALGSGETFLGFSWQQRDLREPGFVPSGLAFPEWLFIRQTLDSDATWLAPGYQRPRKLDTANACALVDKLPLAGFVTPTAASAPTEDYAELFAHAILAEEGKIHPKDKYSVTLQGCPTQFMRAPYFSEGVSAKREYIERQLGL